MDSFEIKSEAFSSAQSRYQSSVDEVKKNHGHTENASRKLGNSAINSDDDLNYFVGFDDVSHLRSPPEICRDLHRYLMSDMLRLRHSRLELLLQELSETFDHEFTFGHNLQNPDIRTNLCATRSVLRLLRCAEPPLSKEEIVRKLCCLSINAQQRSSTIDVYDRYMNGSEATKQVLASPCIDKFGGKVLSKDNSKAVPNDWFGRSKTDKKRFHGDRAGTENSPKLKKSRNESKKPKGEANRSENQGKHYCKFHQARGAHLPDHCFLNRNSSFFKGNEFLRKYEEKEGRKIEN